MKEKKIKKQKLYINTKSIDNEGLKIIKLLLIVALVIGIVYLVTAIVNGEINFSKEKETEETEVTIQKEEILAGQSLNRTDTEYYVLMYNFTSENASLLTAIKDKYVALNKLPVYIVDLDKAFNQKYIVEETETIVEKPKAINELKVKEATLFKVKNNKVTERITSEDKIKTTIKNLTK